ncbi:VOC family protein [Capnocytophaga sp.]|uniref:VOC family protein n=1 Tax=Capnocytophaga sp. TaxID=44737 RepID=UPI0026DCF73A|nr:VOC family protein [Capnocytophaga sp.]MDO5106251.1 VOC family protein [Capnocytophaga sp.]
MATRINPYLNFNGNCEEAFNFYKKAFGGDFRMISRAGDNPMEVPENEKNRIMYIELPIGEHDNLMGSDIFESFGQQLVIGNHNYVSIAVDSKAEADRLFYALSDGGEIEMPISEQFFGYFGSFKDKFCISWMIIFEG